MLTHGPGLRQLNEKIDWVVGYPGQPGGVDFFQPMQPYMIEKGRAELSWRSDLEKPYRPAPWKLGDVSGANVADKPVLLSWLVSNS